MFNFLVRRVHLSEWKKIIKNKISLTFIILTIAQSKNKFNSLLIGFSFLKWQTFNTITVLVGLINIVQSERPYVDIIFCIRFLKFKKISHTFSDLFLSFS